MTMKLYRVTCKGMTFSSTGQAHGIGYVVAESTDEAYRLMRADLDKRDLGFSKEREMHTIELLADEVPYADCGTTLYLRKRPT